MRALPILCAIAGLVGAPSRAHADDTFETKAAGGETITRLDDLAWLVAETCERATDVQARQCRHVRDTRLAQLAEKPLVVRAGAYVVEAWSSAKKSAELGIAGCLACGAHALALAGKPLEVTASAPRADGSVAPIFATAKPFATAAARDQAAAIAAGSHVDLVVKLPAKPTWTAGARAGVALDVIGYRVVACDGSILAANPPSAPQPAEPKTCAKQ